MKTTWNYKPCQFSVPHKPAYKTAQIMPNLAGWRAGLLLLLMLLLKPYIALVTLYCCIVALYSFILTPFNPYIALVALYCCIVALYSFIRAQLKPHIALAALYFCIIAPYSFILTQYGSCGSILHNCNIISHHSGSIWPHCGPICCLAGWLAAWVPGWLAGWLPGWLPPNWLAVDLGPFPF